MVALDSLCHSVGWSVGRLVGQSVDGLACSLACLLEGGLSSSIEEMFLHKNQYGVQRQASCRNYRNELKQKFGT